MVHLEHFKLGRSLQHSLAAVFVAKSCLCFHLCAHIGVKMHGRDEHIYAGDRQNPNLICTDPGRNSPTLADCLFSLSSMEVFSQSLLPRSEVGPCSFDQVCFCRLAFYSQKYFLALLTLLIQRGNMSRVRNAITSPKSIILQDLLFGQMSMFDSCMILKQGLVFQAEPLKYHWKRRPAFCTRKASMNQQNDSKNLFWVRSTPTRFQGESQGFSLPCIASGSKGTLSQKTGPFVSQRSVSSSFFFFLPCAEVCVCLQLPVLYELVLLFPRCCLV